MRKINVEAKNNFAKIEDYVNEDKNLQEKSIILSPKLNNVGWLNSDINVIGSISKETFSLVVEQKKDFSKYGIKLKCSLVSEPFFRFDSEGPTHRNSDNSIPLGEQFITTPHFQKFNEQGKSIAFKTDTLNISAEAEQIRKDINFGFAHFCYTSKSVINDDFHQEISYSQGCAPQPTLFDDIEGEISSIENINFD